MSAKYIVNYTYIIYSSDVIIFEVYASIIGSNYMPDFTKSSMYMEGKLINTNRVFV